MGRGAMAIRFDWRWTVGQAASWKESMDTEPSTVRSIDISFVANHFPSVQWPSKGGVPVKVAVTLVPGQLPLLARLTVGGKTATRTGAVTLPAQSPSRKLRS